MAPVYRLHEAFIIGGWGGDLLSREPLILTVAQPSRWAGLASVCARGSSRPGPRGPAPSDSRARRARLVLCCYSPLQVQAPKLKKSTQSQHTRDPTSLHLGTSNLKGLFSGRYIGLASLAVFPFGSPCWYGMGMGACKACGGGLGPRVL